MDAQSYYKGSLTFGLFDVTEIQFLGIARVPLASKLCLFACVPLCLFLPGLSVGASSHIDHSPGGHGAKNVKAGDDLGHTAAHSKCRVQSAASKE